MTKRKYYLLNYIFIIGIILLFLNDHFLKWEFSNWFTGKFSDFIGLLIFPFFLSFLFPKEIKWNVVLTGVFFVFWKSPFSQGLIDFYNSITFIEITRIVDYSDLIALFILPLSYYLLKRIYVLEKFYINNINPIIVLLPSIIIFMATSPPYWHSFVYSEGNVKFFKNIVNVRMSQEEVLKKMEAYNIEAVIDTTFEDGNYRAGYIKELGYYNINQLIIENDTIHNLKFSMVSFKDNKTKIFINALNISKDIEEKDVKKKLRRYYRKLLKKYIKESVK